MTEPTVLATLSDFHRQVLDAEGPVVVDFSGAACGPCRRLAPVLSDLAARYEGRVRVVVVDVGETPLLAEPYRVRAIPTLLAFRKGAVVAQQVGFGARAPVERLFDQLVG